MALGRITIGAVQYVRIWVMSESAVIMEQAGVRRSFHVVSF